MTITRCLSFVAGLFGAVLSLGLLPVVAIAGEGLPYDWQTGFQKAYSPTMERITTFNDWLFILISVIVIFVLALLVYVMWRFSETKNPNPSRTTHNTLIEVIWTVVPAVILVLVAIPSFKLLYFADSNPDAELTVKAIGRQWYWSYEYPDNGNFIFDSYMVADGDLKPGEPRLLQTDTAMVIPVDTPVRLLITASDVLHAFAMPSMGLKLDAVPGRINETWVQATETGIYYGQCSELCGTDHSYMPIMLKVVSKADYDEWVKQAQEEYARVEEPAAPAESPEQPVQLAERSE
ncbi:MAG: cytochrome c oxidase subunit II [Pseudomonadota bacterium]